MKHFKLLFFGSLIFSQVSCAKFSDKIIHGTVRDKGTSLPIYNVSVLLGETPCGNCFYLKESVTTNEGGQFIISTQLNKNKKYLILFVKNSKKDGKVINSENFNEYLIVDF